MKGAALLVGLTVVLFPATTFSQNTSSPRAGIGAGGAPIGGSVTSGTSNGSGSGVAPAGAGGVAGGGSSQLFAVVNADATIARGKGDVSATKDSTGNYIVTFARNVRNCAYHATIGLTGASGVAEPGFITVVGASAAVNGVFVTTDDTAGVSADRPFHLYVNC